MPTLPMSSAERPKRAVVVGYGSIGRRHHRLLEELGCTTSVVSARDIGVASVRRSIADAINDNAPDYVVIANETVRHHGSVQELAAARFRGSVLVEKPLFHEVAAVPANDFDRLLVAYNLRFHPVLQRVRDLLAGEELVSASIYVGQYLPSWRPGTDYHSSYSASRAGGGGVLRDLSHDLDYALWLLGPWQRVAALGGQLSELEIDSEDAFALLLETERCPLVSVQLNYLDRTPRRQLVINTRRRTIAADFIVGEVSVDGERQHFAVDRDAPYRAMHEAILTGRGEAACTVTGALDVLALIQAAERAAADRQWVTR